MNKTFTFDDIAEIPEPRLHALMGSLLEGEARNRYLKPLVIATKGAREKTRIAILRALNIREMEGLILDMEKTRTYSKEEVLDAQQTIADRMWDALT